VLPGEGGQPLLVVLVDEAADLCLRGGYEVRAGLARLAMRGREHGVRMWICAQKPDARVIGTELRANLPLRLLGRMASVEDARLAAGRPGSGAEHLQHAGDFVAVNGEQLLRFRGPVWQEP
jgi:S-DNA-T family DNA segregation ATPase FtsK/SpoIIIE